jgi:putative transposase
MMPKKRKRHSNEFKAKVALEAVKGLKTTAELAAEFQVHPGMVSQWKSQLVSEASSVFSGNSKESVKSEDELTAPLYEKIGRLEVELDWVKKKVGPLH